MRALRHQRTAFAPAALDFCEILVILIFALVCSVSAEQHDPHPQIFRTEPTFKPPRITILNQTNETSLLAPGYIFFDPRGDLEKPGPCILDHNGDIVFWGAPMLEDIVERDQNVRVCDYLGQKGNHICWSEIAKGLRSINRVFDNTYTQVGEDYSQVAEDFHAPNPHEFNDVDNGNSFLQAVWDFKKFNLTAYKGPEDGRIIDSCFQEVDFRTRKETFRWCASEHFPLWETFKYLKNNGINETWATSAPGTHKHPWDWGHINAIDKNEEGDYVASVRHFNQIVKVAGIRAKEVHGVEPGTVLWKLGGRNSTFEIPEEDAFALQHHVRFRKTTANETVLSFFNNGQNHVKNRNFTDEQRTTDARIMLLNNVTNTAHALRKYPFPDRFLHAPGQGAVNILSNNNVFVGWGGRPFFTEFTYDGRVLFHVNFGADNTTEQAYRSYKFQWKGFPTWKPKLLAYSRNCTRTPLIAYASWNGATEVRSWRFSISTAGPAGPWFAVGTYPREGFETRVNLTASLALAKLAAYGPDFSVRHVKVAALNASDHELGAQTAPVFVPNGRTSAQNVTCGADGCDRPTRFTYDEWYSMGSECGVDRRVPGVLGVLGMVLAAVAVESWTWLYHVFCDIPSPIFYFAISYDLE